MELPTSPKILLTACDLNASFSVALVVEHYRDLKMLVLINSSDALYRMGRGTPNYSTARTLTYLSVFVVERGHGAACLRKL